MVGMNLVFNKEVQIGTDSFNNPTTEIQPITVEDCLVAPITEPQNIREEQALQQSRDQIRIHMPKTSSADVGDSNVVYDNRVFHVDSDSTKFMDGNTPTRWNRYFRAELVANYVASTSALFDYFITEDGDNFFISEDSYYYFAQEMIV